CAKLGGTTTLFFLGLTVCLLGISKRKTSPRHAPEWHFSKSISVGRTKWPIFSCSRRACFLIKQWNHLKRFFISDSDEALVIPNPALGVLLHWLGGLASASFYVPYRGVRRWSWETYWLVGGFFSWIIAPWVLGLIMTRDLPEVLSETPEKTLF